MPNVELELTILDQLFVGIDRMYQATIATESSVAIPSVQGIQLPIHRTLVHIPFGASCGYSIDCYHHNDEVQNS